LDSVARNDRFGHAISDADIAAYTSRLPIERGVLAGIFPDGTLRGLIEARPAAGDSAHWECVLSVESAWRRQGLGTALTAKTFPDARRAGASRIYLRCSTANIAAQHFFGRLSRTLREDDGDTVATIDLDEAGAHRGNVATLNTRRARG
jgi:GNAT superfamily N-acetyltransferase